MSMWWAGRRDALLAELADALVFFGADVVEDPGIGELAHTTETLAGEYRTSDRGPHLHQAGNLLAQAATELRTADRFRGTLLPIVTHHLRCAAVALAHARACLQAPVEPTAETHPGVRWPSGSRSAAR
ncbi:hypothetical protein F7Q99_28455 [Streptomyces kaniharaensis]|uniref:Uncharacterized protein n=1 Tax=Streptomyces kaniharaensis TaxID=212423 RepID=A0A6N7L079_9ACTN|nr:hypothetical protein [Streptomyces kaniharaensis]MQS16067.1 hypothetical protein [Streptomyces kaniharaensis]